MRGGVARRGGPTNRPSPGGSSSRPMVARPVRYGPVRQKTNFPVCLACVPRLPPVSFLPGLSKCTENNGGHGRCSTGAGPQSRLRRQRASVRCSYRLCDRRPSRRHRWRRCRVCRQQQRCGPSIDLVLVQGWRCCRVRCIRCCRPGHSRCCRSCCGGWRLLCETSVC